MKNELGTPLERKPDQSLFTMQALYAMQPWEVLKDHVDRLRHLELENLVQANLYQLELRDRANGLEDFPSGFERFQDSVEDLSDKDLRRIIDEQRDRRLTILSHYSMMTTVATNRLKQE